MLPNDKNYDYGINFNRGHNTKYHLNMIKSWSKTLLTNEAAKLKKRHSMKQIT